MGILVRVKMIGSGKPSDPYRVNLPTYGHVHGNITHGYAIVSIPDDVHGLSEDDLADEEAEETTEGKLYSKLSDSKLKAIHAHFDKKYQERKDEFRIEHAE